MYRKTNEVDVIRHLKLLFHCVAEMNEIHTQGVRALSLEVT